MPYSQKYVIFLYDQEVWFTSGKYSGFLGRAIGEAKLMVHVRLSSGKVVFVWKASVKKNEESEASPCMAGSTTVLDSDTEVALRLLVSSLTRMGINHTSQKAQDIFLGSAKNI